VYKAAHRAHFSEGNAAAAVRGYEEYLRVAPSGRFATEAAYNRGLCLVRLGRHAEARQALQPFADGRYGSYRRDSATKLLARISRVVPILR
jgi:hypothetical protein